MGIWIELRLGIPLLRGTHFRQGYSGQAPAVA